jgi:NAD-dependent dihydropyrimidine dehydrogenase PreA subunit
LDYDTAQKVIECREKQWRMSSLTLTTQYKTIKETGPNQEIERTMVRKVYVDEDTCIGCGNCESICPEVFQLNE